ncbi:MAG: hypothetical protein ACP5L4_06820 [Thermoplasmata archaeon]
MTRWITKKGSDGENRHIPIQEGQRRREKEISFDDYKYLAIDETTKIPISVFKNELKKEINNINWDSKEYLVPNKYFFKYANMPYVWRITFTCCENFNYEIILFNDGVTPDNFNEKRKEKGWSYSIHIANDKLGWSKGAHRYTNLTYDEVVNIVKNELLEVDHIEESPLYHSIMVK